jgi:hypothetical protein
VDRLFERGETFSVIDSLEFLLNEPDVAEISLSIRTRRTAHISSKMRGVYERTNGRFPTASHRRVGVLSTVVPGSSVSTSHCRFRLDPSSSS